MKTVFLSLFVYFLTFFSPAFSQIINGKASYYADKFEDRPTASGEPYKAGKLTAAHKTLPFGTLVKVTNRKNGKFVIVRINDRGPFTVNRVIDLSKSAAKKLDFIRDGVTHVEVVVLNDRATPYCLDLDDNEVKLDGVYLQLGSFGIRANAYSLAKTIQEKYDIPVTIAFANEDNKPLFRVIAGPTDDKSTHQSVKKLQKSFPEAISVSYHQH